jgi:hypothetical protein
MREELKKMLDSYLNSQGIKLTEEQYEKALTLIKDDIRNQLDEFLISYYVTSVVVTNG